MSKVEERFFAILKDYFSPLYDRVRGKPLEKAINEIHEIYSPTLMKTMLESLKEELLALDWETQNKTIETLGGLKTSYLGDVYMYLNQPSQTFDFLKKTALYADTTIIKDPVLSELLAFHQRGTGEVPSFELAAVWALNMFEIEDLFSSDLSPPICSLAASSFLSLEKKGVRKNIDHYFQEKVTPFYASEILGKDFTSSEELIEYLGKFKTFEEFASVLNKYRFPLINPEGTLVNEEKFFSIKNYYERKYNFELSFAEALFYLLRGRYSWVPYDIVATGNLTSNYVTDFKGVWKNLLALMKKDNELISEYVDKKVVSKDMLIMKALQHQELKWLGNVPLEKIRALRERGELQDLRADLGRNLDEIKNTNDEEFVQVVSQVKYSLDESFKKHNSEVDRLDEIYRRRYKIKATSIITSGSIAIISAVFPSIASIVSISSALLGSFSISSLIKDFINKREKTESLQRKPIAMLFDAKPAVSD